MASVKICFTTAAVMLIVALMCMVYSSSAKPINNEKRLRAFRNMGKSKFVASSSIKRSSKECEELLGTSDYREFADEIAYAFLNSGNTNALDNILSYMVELNCLTIKETLTFRKELTTLYNLINKEEFEYEMLNQSEKRKRNLQVSDQAQQQQYYEELDQILSELAVLHLEDEKSAELLNYMVEYILGMAESNQITIQEANKLLRRIYDSAQSKAFAEGGLDLSIQQSNNDNTHHNANQAAASMEHEQQKKSN